MEAYRYADHEKNLDDLLLARIRLDWSAFRFDLLELLHLSSRGAWKAGEQRYAADRPRQCLGLAVSADQTSVGRFRFQLSY